MKKEPKRAKKKTKSLFSDRYQYLLSIFLVGFVSLVCAPLANTPNYHVVSYILLFLVLLISTFMGIGPVLLASSLSVLIWNFFFIPPHLTFHIEKTEDLLIFGLFFIIAFVNGVLTTRIRRQELLAREREKRTDSLFRLTRELSKASGMEAVLEVAIEKIRNHFSVHSFFILQDGNNTLYSNGLLQKEKKLAQAEYEVAEWSFKQGKIAGRHTAFAPETLYTFFPLSGTRINPGVLAIQTEKPFREEQKSYWDTFLALISNALEREFLGELAQKVRFLDESDRLYKTLFNSISHELRIPVATIMGASETILHNEGTVEIKSELCKEIVTASLRLNRLIENLLNMSRLESGHIRVRLDWCDMNDLFNKVLEDLADELKPFSSEVFIAPEMPLVKVDFGLMEQVLYNLVYNSTQYTPQGLLIRLSAKYENGKMFLEIADQGPGFPENEIRNVFKKFSRIDRNKTGGLGLGLSIAKGFIQAHNGIIEVENRTEGGACFTIAIPSDKLDFETM